MPMLGSQRDLYLINEVKEIGFFWGLKVLMFIPHNSYMFYCSRIAHLTFVVKPQWTFKGLNHEVAKF